MRVGRLIDEHLDLRRGTGADASRNLATLREYGEHRDRLDAEPSPQLGQRFSVHLYDKNSPRLPHRHFLKLGPHHPAGTAPRSPIVDDHGYGSFRNDDIELEGTFDLDRLGRRAQLTLALPAARRAAQSFVEDSVLLSAGSTRDDDAAVIDHNFSHRLSPQKEWASASHGP